MLMIRPLVEVPPHGQEDVPDMKTIFDLEHLKQAGNCHFLNIQCKLSVIVSPFANLNKNLDRMPSPIAAFISSFVYDRKLLSQHPIQSSDCLAFIDASRTAEEKVGTSRRVSRHSSNCVDRRQTSLTGRTLAKSM